jgi:hypothetical protein
MTTRIDGELVMAGPRVRAAWVVLAVATLIKAACAAWLGWVVWQAAVMMWAVAAMLHGAPSPTRSLSSMLVGVGVLAGVGFLFGLIVAAVQHRVLDWRLRWILPAWTLRSAAAAAAVCAAWGVVVPAFNRIHFPGPGLAIGQFVACAIGEGLAMFAVQRPLIAACRGRLLRG